MGMDQRQQGFLAAGPEREAKREFIQLGIMFQAQPGKRCARRCRGTCLLERMEKGGALGFREILHDHRVVDHRRPANMLLRDFAREPRGSRRSLDTDSHGERNLHGTAQGR